MEFIGTWWSLIPPIIAIVLALKTKEVYLSLFLGIFIGGLLLTRFDFFLAILKIYDVMVAELCNPWNVGILLFLVLLGIIVSLINRAGGSKAYGDWARKKIKSRKGSILLTVLLGSLIFIDDYFNCLTVGSVMRPITDEYKVSRAKLAYIIDATAAPICIISPISSWAAAVSGYSVEDGFSLFLQATPYNLYAWLTIFMVIYITVRNIDFGLMLKHEKAAQHGDLHYGVDEYVDEEDDPISTKGKVYDLILPIVFLIVSCILCMVYTGGFFDNVPFMEAFANCDAAKGLVLGATLTLIFVFLLYMSRRVIKYEEFATCIPAGFKSMVPSICILILAWTLGSIVADELQAGVFVANSLESLNISMIFLPAIVFVVAIFLAFATGTSWGTFAILLPIVMSIYADNPYFLVLATSSTLAGAVCGDHISPISDTTIMASAGAKCYHLHHVSTQMPYAMVVAIASVIGYLVAAIFHNLFITYFVSIAIILIMLAYKKKQTEKAQ